MPPKSASAQTAEEAAGEREASRLRKRADGAIIDGTPPQGRATIPRALLRSDGADIVKRNAGRKKKYLFVFPGGASLPPGAKVGELTGLDTKTPILYVDYGEGGVKMRGSLVFPKNGLVCVGGGKKVRVVDCFDVAVVFAEWEWKGEDGRSEDVPMEVRGKGVWENEWEEKIEGKIDGKVERRVQGKTSRVRREKDGNEGEDEDEDVVELGSEEEDEDVVQDDVVGEEDEWAARVQVAPREGSRRKRNRVNYADVENLNDDLNDDSEEEEQVEVEQRQTKKKRRISFSQLSDDNSGGDDDGDQEDEEFQLDDEQLLF